MKSYTEFAHIYDKLMHADVNYEHWADYIENIFDMYDINPSLVCDLACGTGNITIPMSRRGYDMTGVDISEDMLNTAREKSVGLDILYLNQSLTKLDLYGSMGAFLCMIDGFNYILSPKQLENIFKRLKTCFMDPNALLIFDISSRHKLKNIIGNNTFIHSEKDIFYSWQNRYIEDKNISDMMLTFFTKSDKGYRRFEERHLQRAYSEKEIKYLLKNAGFKEINTYNELTFDSATPESERIVFIAR